MIHHRATFEQGLSAGSQALPGVWHPIAKVASAMRQRTWLRRRLLAILMPFCLLTACTLSIPSGPGAATGVRVGPVHRVMRAPYAYEPDIAVDPTNPDRLVASANSPSTSDCDPVRQPGSCTINVFLYLSTDGGASWQEHQLTPDGGGNATVAFASDGTPYAAGLWNLESQLLFVRRGLPDRTPNLADIDVLSTASVDKPWLTVDVRTGELYVAYSAATGDGHEGIELVRSNGGGAIWSAPVVVTPGPLTFTPNGQVVIPPFGAQALPGDGNHVLVTWIDPAQPKLDLGSNHRLLRVASSTDGGATFASPRIVTDTQSNFASTAHDGTYYALFRRGQDTVQQMVLAQSQDNGQTWTTTLVGGGHRLFADWSPAPGLGVAPDGTVDAVYYAPEWQCFDPAKLAAARQSQTTQNPTTWTDPCTYDVWYTFSKDYGKSWIEPRRLNAKPIRGDQFVHIQGMSRPGDYIGMASTDRYAYPIWIDGTAAYTTRIQR